MHPRSLPPSSRARYTVGSRVSPATVAYALRITGTIDDYKLLEDMNEATAERYSEMTQQTDRVALALSGIREKCRLLGIKNLS